MISINLSRVACTAVIGALVGATATSAQARSQCAPDNDAVLERLNVDPDKVSRKQFEIVYAGVTGMGVTGYRIWLLSDRCAGSVVVNFDTNCRVIGTFPRGNCSMASVRK